LWAGFGEKKGTLTVWSLLGRKWSLEVDEKGEERASEWGGGFQTWRLCSGESGFQPSSPAFDQGRGQ